ncbi:N-6 DNA methylase [Vibrio owensii]|uniref:N-6 DNA methylase n=1 Tax=Vibrio owensii TaxID=696485 RepID=UPI0033989D6C
MTMTESIRVQALEVYVSTITSRLEKLYTSSTRNPLEMLVDDLFCEFGQKHPAPLSEKEREVLFEATKLYGEAVCHYPFRDILGPIYMELASRGHKKAMGQFFTPTCVTELMAKMTMHDCWDQLREKASKNEEFGVCEPCCGAGAMLMGAIREVFIEAPELLPYMSIYGVDKDRLVSRMCGAQLLCNMLIHRVSLGRLCIIHGDALTVEEYETIVFAENKDRKPLSLRERVSMLHELVSQQQSHWQNMMPAQPQFPIAL